MVLNFPALRFGKVKQLFYYSIVDFIYYLWKYDSSSLLDDVLEKSVKEFSLSAFDNISCFHLGFFVDGSETMGIH